MTMWGSTPFGRSVLPDWSSRGKQSEKSATQSTTEPAAEDPATEKDDPSATEKVKK